MNNKETSITVQVPMLIWEEYTINTTFDKVEEIIDMMKSGGGKKIIKENNLYLYLHLLGMATEVTSKRHLELEEVDTNRKVLVYVDEETEFEIDLNQEENEEK